MDEEKLSKIKDTIEASQAWPGVYMFKFIVPSENSKIALVEAIFSSDTAEIRMSVSKNGNYTSITAKELMIDANQVMEYYRKASEIEGLIAL